MSPKELMRHLLENTSFQWMKTPIGAFKITETILCIICVQLLNTYNKYYKEGRMSVGSLVHCASPPTRYNICSFSDGALLIIFSFQMVGYAFDGAAATAFHQEVLIDFVGATITICCGGLTFDDPDSITEHSPRSLSIYTFAILNVILGMVLFAEMIFLFLNRSDLRRLTQRTRDICILIPFPDEEPRQPVESFSGAGEGPSSLDAEEKLPLFRVDVDRPKEPTDGTSASLSSQSSKKDMEVMEKHTPEDRLSTSTEGKPIVSPHSPDNKDLVTSIDAGEYSNPPGEISLSKEPLI